MCPRLRELDTLRNTCLFLFSTRGQEKLCFVIL